MKLVIFQNSSALFPG